MKHSTDQILTTHTGSLPRPADLVDLLNAKEQGERYDRVRFDERIRRAAFEIVRRQREVGIDVVGDGEHSKVNWMAYARGRLSGLQELDSPVRFRGATRDALAFPGAYEDMKVMLAARSPAIVPKRQVRQSAYVCAGPIVYIGQDELATDLANLKAAVAESGAGESFITAISPSNLELYYENRHYASDEEYLTALADAMHVEYKAIVDAGFVLQIDDPRMVDALRPRDRPRSRIAANSSRSGSRSLNHALRGIPEDRVRFHTCYSINIAPRVHDFELKHYRRPDARRSGPAPIRSRRRIRATSMNGRCGSDVKLPDDKLLLPGVVSHCVLSSSIRSWWRSGSSALPEIVGRENVIAGTDCGFGTSAAGDEIHPDVAWAKLAAMVEGATIASRALWP